MTIPKFSAFLLPLLQFCGDQKEHSYGEAAEWLASHLNLNEDDRKEVLESGQLRLYNRTGWARTYLAKAGLLEGTGRGRFKITSRGLQALAENPGEITREYLLRFPEFHEFKNRNQTDAQKNQEGDRSDSADQTPEEALESAYREIRQALAVELLKRVRTCSPAFFEKLVVDLLLAMGYGGSRRDAGQAVGRSGDGGIDGVIKEDRLGFDVVYIQAKRWDSTVGRPVVQNFTGSLEGQRARKGVLITTSSFSQDARDYASRIEKKIVLIDGEQLADYMIDFQIGVDEIVSYSIKKIDNDYFSDEG